MKKFVLAAFCTVSLVSFVLADEFTAVITKVDGNKVTYFKTKAPDPGAGGKKAGGGKAGGAKGGFGGFGAAEKTGDAINGTASASVKVVKGKFDMDTKKFGPGDPIEGGLTNDMFKNIDAEKGLTATITIADDGADKGKITQIMPKGGGKGGAGGFKGGAKAGAKGGN